MAQSQRKMFSTLLLFFVLKRGIRLGHKAGDSHRGRELEISTNDALIVKRRRRWA